MILIPHYLAVLGGFTDSLSGCRMFCTTQNITFSAPRCLKFNFFSSLLHQEHSQHTSHLFLYTIESRSPSLQRHTCTYVVHLPRTESIDVIFASLPYIEEIKYWLFSTKEWDRSLISATCKNFLAPAFPARSEFVAQSALHSEGHPVAACGFIWYWQESPPWSNTWRSNKTTKLTRTLMSVQAALEQESLTFKKTWLPFFGFCAKKVRE